MTTELTPEQEYAKLQRVHELTLTPSQLKLIKRVTLLADDRNNRWQGWTQGAEAVDGNRFRFNSDDTHALASEVTGNPYYYQRHNNEKRAGCNLLAKMMVACGWNWPKDVAIWSRYSHDRMFKRAADSAYAKAGATTPASAACYAADTATMSTTSYRDDFASEAEEWDDGDYIADVEPSRLLAEYRKIRDAMEQAQYAIGQLDGEVRETVRRIREEINQDDCMSARSYYSRAQNADARRRAEVRVTNEVNVVITSLNGLVRQLEKARDDFAYNIDTMEPLDQPIR